MAQTRQTITTYLQMLEPSGQILPSIDGAVVQHMAQPDLDLYRRLYKQVGGPWYWVDRNRLTDEQLRAIIHHDLVEIHLLNVGEQIAGFAELDRRQPDEIELVYFGLTPDHIGRGLGPYFLNHIVRHAWSYQPGRVWLHTCDLDHPSAKGVYERAGFIVYDRQQTKQSLE